MTDFGRRRAAEMKSWVIGGSSYEDIAQAYDIPPHKVRDIVFARRDHRKPLAQIIATEAIITAPAPTREEMEAEPLCVIDSHMTGSKLTPEMSFERAHQMYRWKRTGLSNRKIGDKYGITPERVSQVLSHHGFPSSYDPTWKQMVASTETAAATSSSD